MLIKFSKLSDTEHRISVTRADGTAESRLLNSRSFLFHDIAHLALESEIPLKGGFWGSVASGASLYGSNFSGSDIAQAEALAGPMQTLVKSDAEAKDYLVILERVIPNHPRLDEVASSIHDRVRELKGMWRATNFGRSMETEWLD